MRTSHKILLGFGISIVAVVLAVSALSGWFGAKKLSRPPLAVVTNDSVASTNASSFFKRRPPTERQPTNAPEVADETLATEEPASWEDKLDQILGADVEDSDKCKKMLALFPKLPEDGQVEVAQHLANLLPDEGFEPMGKVLANPKTPEAVSDVLLTDVLNRANGLKMPLLLDIARKPDHPKAAEAKDMLELYLEEDYGSNWNVWGKKVGEWLKENPD